MSGQRASLSAQRGSGFLELMAVVALGGMVLAIGIPALADFYHRQMVVSTAATTRSTVGYVRVKAIKEKVAHRIVFHDENAATPNTIEIKREQGGSFVTLADQTHKIPSGVRFLDDSMDALTVGSRGGCNAGHLYIQGPSGAPEVVAITPTCRTYRP